jgi:hypothetical protein
MTKPEDNANDSRTNESGTRFVELQQQIHDALRVQHPEWVEPDGDCPTCESYESRLAELLALTTQEHTTSRSNT